MPLQILTLKLKGITAGDYLTWCRDPEPPALDFALRSVRVDAAPLGDTITAILDWDQPAPAPAAAATAAGLPLSAGVQIHPLLVTDAPHTNDDRTPAEELAGENPELAHTPATLARSANPSAFNPPFRLLACWPF